MHKIPEGSDKHPMVVVGLLAGLFTCADKHRQACWAAAGCVGVAEHFERLDPLKDHNDLLSKSWRTVQLWAWRDLVLGIGRKAGGFGEVNTR
jgi:hypothetical protein